MGLGLGLRLRVRLLELAGAWEVGRASRLDLVEQVREYVST